MAANHWKLSRLVALSLVTSFAANASFGATSTYVQLSNTSGTWNGNANWASGDLPAPPTSGTGPVPHLAGDVAIIQQLVTTAATGNPQINLANANETIGSLIVRNTTNEFTTSVVTNTGILIFDNGLNPATFTEMQGTGSSNTSRTRINAPVTLNSDLIVEQDHNLSRNTATEFVQQVIADATKTLTKTGMGSLQFAYGFGSDGFQGNVDIKTGDIRLINGVVSSVTPPSNTVFNQAAGILVEDGSQFQLGNTVSSFNIAPGAEVKINGTGNTSNTDPNNGFKDGALRFEESAGSNITVSFNSPVRMQTSSKIYVTAPDTMAVLTQELRGDGTAGLTKGGSGLLKLATTSANGNPYAGTTVVSKGTLAVNNTVSTASGVGSGNLNITDSGSGAALGGTGYIGTAAAPSNVTLTGNVADTIGARLYPGDLNASLATGNLTTSPGVLTIRGNLSFDALSSLNVDITGAAVGTEYDQVVEHGTVTLGGAGLNINLGSYSPTGSETFNLIDNAGSQAVVGTFGAINGMAGTYNEGATVTLGSANYILTYLGGANHNDVELIGANVPMGVPGDFNGNGVVDAADYVLWRNGGPLQNRVSGSGPVTAQDYLDWKARFGNTAGSGSGSRLGQSASVPEPGTACLLLVGIAVGLVNSRKR